MRKLRIGIIDVVANSPSTSLYARAMRANLAAIMPQVLAVWCEEEGHDVFLAYYSGHQNLVEDLPGEVVVSVRDEGPGIPDGRLAAAVAEGRLGVDRSIRGRLADLQRINDAHRGVRHHPHCRGAGVAGGTGP